jgi:pyridoxine 5-phosphate synthase
MTRLSVNVNKIALWRNARGGNFPNLQQVVRDCERFGAEGITIHPRPDQRHIRESDVWALSRLVQTEFNVEGYPSEAFLALVDSVRPHQVTLVPDSPDALTSSQGWDTLGHAGWLKEVVARLQESGCRVSLFVEPQCQMVEGASAIGTNRVEFYTGPYAEQFPANPEAAISPYLEAARMANELGLGINAGHDLNLPNLTYWCQHVPATLEVSIGHALWVDAVYYGMENTIRMYRRSIANGLAASS